MTQTATSAHIFDVAAHDTLKAGDVITLARHFPAGYRGPNQPAETYRATFTLAKILRLPDSNGRPQFYAEGREPEHAGCWAVGVEANGMVTTMTRVD